MEYNPIPSRVWELNEQVKRADSAKRELESIQNTCKHQWGEVVADHIVTKGYQHPGDPVGTMGIDWQGPMWIQGGVEERWRRTCKICGKVEWTSQQTETKTYTPKFKE